ncbi:dTMP kinase [bacterium]|nr:MAG: dTMP kinase [bacterium]RKZ26400.1 MAG: dTMP kinase [bacterium]
MKGFFISFEGVEGSGKTLQSALLFNTLKNFYDTILTREPGGTEAGEKIREILLHVSVDPVTELLLFCAARREHVERVIRPALEEGKIVICDRFMDSTLAYQGGGRGISFEIIQELNRISTGGLEPDLTILLDVPPEVGIKRIRGERDRIEKEELEFHRRVREAYLEIARREPHRVVVVDGTGEPEEVRKNIEKIVMGRLK